MDINQLFILAIALIPILLVWQNVNGQLTSTSASVINASNIGNGTAFCENLKAFNNQTYSFEVEHLNATALKQCVAGYNIQYQSFIANQKRMMAVANSTPKYTDPQSRFSINYPGNWTVTPGTNRFQLTLVTFSNYPHALFGVAIFRMNNTTTDPSVAIGMYHNPMNIPIGSSIFQDVECIKYHVDGKKACSIIFTGINPATQIPVVAQEIVSNVNGIMFAFNMGGTQDNFDSYLPTFEKMMASFRSPP